MPTDGVAICRFASMRLRVRIGTIITGIIYLSALAIAGFLLWQTLQMSSTLITFSTGAITPTTAPEPTATSAPVLILPTPIPPTPLPTAAPPEPETIGYHPKSGRYIAVWLPPNFVGDARDSFFANVDIIDDISPFWYTTDASGRLYGQRDDELVEIAHKNNVRIIPSIHNVNNPGAVVPVLSNPQLRARHIQNIVDEVLARNYDGIDIDYESLAPSLRDDFTTFIVDLAAALHAHNKLLTVAVHAKDRDDGGLGAFQDWAAIGPHVDQLRIMTYDYHWRGSGPGPVAPAYWIEAVANYAREVVDPAKVLLGVHFYGYDWPPNGNATARPWRIIEEIINEYQPTVSFIERNARGRVGESTFTYRTSAGTRTVWFMTDTGLADKIATVQRLDLAGIAIWQLGYERPEYWQTVRANLVQDSTLIQRALNALLPDH